MTGSRACIVTPGVHRGCFNIYNATVPFSNHHHRYSVLAHTQLVLHRPHHLPDQLDCSIPSLLVTTRTRSTCASLFPYYSMPIASILRHLSLAFKSLQTQAVTIPYAAPPISHIDRRSGLVVMALKSVFRSVLLAITVVSSSRLECGLFSTPSRLLLL